MLYDLILPKKFYRSQTFTVKGIVTIPVKNTFVGMFKYRSALTIIEL